MGQEFVGSSVEIRTVMVDASSMLKNLHFIPKLPRSTFLEDRTEIYLCDPDLHFESSNFARIFEEQPTHSEFELVELFSSPDELMVTERRFPDVEDGLPWQS